jgi:hypothetical protein
VNGGALAGVLRTPVLTAGLSFSKALEKKSVVVSNGVDYTSTDGNEHSHTTLSSAHAFPGSTTTRGHPYLRRANTGSPTTSTGVIRLKMALLGGRIERKLHHVYTRVLRFRLRAVYPSQLVS